MNFALIGAAGYIAPRHMQAIKDVGGRLIAIMDISDSVGFIDRISPDAELFTDINEFKAYIESKKGTDEEVAYITICSPNHFHKEHMLLALDLGTDAICEKPLVLDPKDIDEIKEKMQTTGKNVYTILQTRLHPSIIALKEKIEATDDAQYDIEFTTITPRGRWYQKSWKGYMEKSGGIATNIGIHFFDMLMWIFGSVKENTVNLHSSTKAAGMLTLEHATVSWYLSIDREDLPQSAIDAGHPSYRSIKLNGEEIEYSGGFTDLHTRSYEEILKGNGFTIDDARPSIQVAYDIRNASPTGPEGNPHSFLK